MTRSHSRTEVDILAKLHLFVKSTVIGQLVGDVNVNFNKTRDNDVKLYKEFLRRHQLCNLIQMNTCHSHQGHLVR